jgi:hypothetical protein
LIPAFAHDRFVEPEQDGTVVLRTTLPAEDISQTTAGQEQN